MSPEPFKQGETQEQRNFRRLCQIYCNQVVKMTKEEVEEELKLIEGGKNELQQ